jgi:hypothetical protein
VKGIFSKDHKGYGHGGHLSVYLDKGVIKSRLQSTSKESVLVSSQISAGQKYHAVISFGPAGNKLYVNGKLVKAESDFRSGLIGNIEPIVIGALQWSSSPGTANRISDEFAGTLHKVVLYPKQLSDVEIAGLMNSVPQPAPQPQPQPQPDPTPQPTPQPTPDPAPTPAPQPDPQPQPQPQPDPSPQTPLTFNLTVPSGSSLLVKDSSQIELSDTDMAQFNLTLQIPPAQTESVRFTLSGPVSVQRIENTEPYTLMNDSNVGQPVQPGTYQLRVEIFTGDNATAARSAPVSLANST